MNIFKEFYIRFLSKLNAYVVVIILFVAFTFTVGDSNLYQRYIYDETIRQLENEIELNKREIESNRKKLQDLSMDTEGLERFAREEYRMQLPDEDVFIIE